MLLSASLADYFNSELLLAAIIGGVSGCAFLFVLLAEFLPEAVVKRMRPGFEVLVLGGPGKPAGTRLSRFKIVAFALLSAVLAAIFQLPYGADLAYIQAFIVGVAWPTLVGQAISQTEGQKILNLADQLQNPPAPAPAPTPTPAPAQ
jgi:Zn-dependent protease with chaperone function